MLLLRRRPEMIVALLLAAAVQLEMWWYDGGPRGVAVVTVTAGILYPGCLALRAQPRLMAALASTVLVAQALLGGRLTTTLLTAVASMVLVFWLAAALGRRSAAAWTAVFLAATWADLFVVGDQEYGLVSDLVFTALIVAGGPFLAGRAMRQWQVRSEELERLNHELAGERQKLADMAVADERARIAREMHDVVAHSVSLMVVQAGAARRLLEQDPARSRQALLSVEAVGREALQELRRALGLLRSGDGRADLAPQPGAGQLEALVSGARAGGLPTELVVEGRPRELGAGLDLAVYRIVQEALTNALKHAGPATATVTLRWGPTTLEVVVTDTGRGAASQESLRSPRSQPGHVGHGLQGLRERVAAYHGSVQVGEITDGGAGTVSGWQVRALLPLERSASLAAGAREGVG